MGYNLINWENSPSKQTPINAENLNQMDVNIAKAIQGTRFNFSATFTSDGVLKNTTSTEALGAGSFATSQTDIVTVFVADNVTKINSGTFSGCTSLKTIYIDNTVGNVEIVSGAVPDGVSIVYSNDDNFINVNELLASAIKSLKSSVNTNRTDWESRATSIETQHKTDVQALTDKANSIVEQANTDRQNFNKSVDEVNANLDTKENVSNKVSVITHPSLDYYPDTKAVFDYVNSKLEIPLAAIESLKADKLDKTDFNSYKTSNDNAVNSKVDTTDFNAYKTSTDKAVGDNTDNIKLLDTNKANLVQSKNLFDMIAYVNLLSTIANSITKGTLNACTDNSFTITSNNTDCYTNLWTSSDNNKFTIIVEPNTTYALSWDCEGASGNVFVFSNATTTKMWQVVNSKKQLIFTTDNDTTFVTVRFGVANANQTATYSNIQIELGEVATDYMPCKIATGVKELDNKVDKLQDFNKTKFTAIADEIINNSIKNTTDKASNIVITDSSNYNIVSLVAENDNYNLTVYGKNLQDFKSLVKVLHTTAYVAKDSLTIKDNTISYDMVEGNYCGIYFRYNEFIKDSLLIDKSCVISLTVTVDKACTFRLLDENSNKSVSKVLEPSTETQISLPITLNQSTKAITFYGVNITETTHIKLSNIMIELGSVATEYEEYKDMQSVTQDTDLSTVHTYYPNTTIIADSDVQLRYVADTKHYIDNKFKELATAIVAHESEVN